MLHSSTRKPPQSFVSWIESGERRGDGVEGRGRWAVAKALKVDAMALMDKLKTDAPSDLVARFLKLVSVVLVALAIVSLAIAILIPAPHSRYFFCGLVALVLAFLCALWRIFFLKLPIHSRGGAIMTAQSHPVSYFIAFVAGSLIGAFLLYILIHSYLSEPLR